MSEIQICELREAGEDGGSLMGYYAKGHHDAWAFAEKANAFSGADSGYDRRHVEPRDVRQTWWRTVPMAGQPGCHQFLQAEPRSRGAWAVTAWDRLYMADFERMERHVDDCRRQREYGFRDGLNWALRQLDVIDEAAGAKLLDAYRAQP